jgi:hypothetical protein
MKMTNLNNTDFTELNLLEMVSLAGGWGAGVREYIHSVADAFMDWAGLRQQ